MSTNLEEIILDLEQRIRELEQSQKLRSVSPFLSNSLNQVSGSARRINFTDQYYIDADGVAHLKEGYFTGSTQDVYDSDTLEGTGFLNRTDSTISFDGSARVFTIAPVSTSFTLYIKNVKILKTTETVTIANTNGLHFIYYNSSGVLTESTSVWDLLSGISPVATVYLLGTTYRLMEERHGCSMPAVTHDYLHNSIGARYSSGLSGTFGNTTFSVAAGVIYDEDIKHSIGSQSQCAVFYRQSGLWNWTQKQSTYYLSSGGILQYDNSGVINQVPVNQYVACYILATNDIDSSIISITGQRVDTTLSAAIANNTFSSLSLGDLPFKEYRHIYTVILRNDATPYEQAIDHRFDISLGIAAVTTDHTLLTNLNSTGYYHLTSEQFTDLTDGGDSNLHYHSHEIEDHTNYVEDGCGSGGFMLFDTTLNMWTNWRPYTVYPNSTANPKTPCVTDWDSDKLDGHHGEDFELKSDLYGGLTQNYLPKFNGSNDFVNSNIYNNSSKVGILTNNPQYTLDVAGDIYGSLTLRTGTSTTGVFKIEPYLFNGIAKSFRLSHDGTTVVDLSKISSDLYSYWSGTLTIGTIRRGTSSESYVVWDAGNLTGDQTAHYHDSRYYTETEADARFLQLSGGAVTGNLTVSGNVGINTLTPDERLQVNGSVHANASVYGNNGVYAFNNIEAGSYIGVFKYQGALQGYPNSYYPVIKTDNTNMYFSCYGKYSASMGSSDDATVFALMNPATSGDTKVYLNTNGNSYFNGGNVGIGASSPEYKLDVRGVIQIKGTASEEIGNTNAPWLYFASPTAVDFTIVQQTLNGLTVNTFYNSTWNERLRVSKNGTISIGNTSAEPVATATPTKLLLDRTFSNGSTKDKCKIVMLEGADGSVYGFSCGSNYDNQYHSQRQHDFYGDNTLRARINGDGVTLPTITSSGSGSAVRIDSNGLLTKDTSSIRYKENVTSDINTEWLYDIQVCQYDRKDGSSKNEIGIIAEELALIKPEMVTFDKDGRIDGYNKIDLIPVLINEVQRLRKEIHQLRDRI